MAREHLFAVAAALALLALSPPAAAEPTVAARAPGPPVGLSLGVEVGEPTSVTARYEVSPLGLAISAGVGSGVRDGHGLQLHGDLTITPIVLRRDRDLRIPIYLGVGARYYRHQYEPASIDEIPDVHEGVRAPIGVAAAFMKLGLEIYIEVAPGYDLYRSESCNLMSGVNSVCPHALSPRGFFQGVIGARYRLF